MPNIRFLTTVVAIALLLAGGLFSAVGAVPANAQDAATPPPATSEYPAVNVVQQVGPAVVTVINEQTVQGGLGTSTQLQPVGSGTGFIIDDQGHIVTNWHVVTGGQQFQVVFASGETRKAKLVGSDQISDLAVVQVSGDVPGTVDFGDSDLLLPGEPVLAIGSPLGQFENTVTEGIVSATNRDFPFDPSQGATQQNYTNLIQHDAPINPGNSGGPLLNLDGEVVGVNTLGIPSENGQPVQGLFFAIPSNTVQQITQQLIENGSVAYAYMGVNVVELDPTIAAQNQLDVDYGAYVTAVNPGDPAADAGIEVNDIITAIGDQQVDQNNTFTEILYSHQPGETVSVTIDRGGKQQTVDVTLGKRPANL